VVFGARKNEVVEPSVRMDMPEGDPLLRNEVDPDPLVEEMVGRLREGLSSLVAVDEWGRPLAWRNVVRLALGPLAGRLRDTEQALELAVSMMPAPAETAPAAPAPEAVSVLEPPAATEYVAQPPAEHVAERFVAPENPTPMEYLAAPSALAAEPTVEVILPASEAAPETPLAEPPPQEVQERAVPVEEPVVVDEPIAEEPAAPVAEEDESGREVAGQPAPVHTVPQVQPAVVPPTAATSLFTVSGDQRAVPVSPLGSGQLLGGGSADDTTTAKYDRFLTGLYGQGQQVRGDEDRGSR
jgi:hypothetical protein